MKYRIVLKIAGTSQYEFFTDVFPAAQILAGVLASSASVDGVEVWDGTRLLSKF